MNGRIYLPTRNGERTPRYYADFRDYADVGGRQMALKPPGSKRATTDPAVAEVLCAEILRELEAKRRGIVLAPPPSQRAGAQLKPFAREHLIAKKEAGRFTDHYLGQVEKQLGRAVEFFGSARVLVSIRPDDVKAWIKALRKHDNGRGGSLSDKTVRDHLNSLSNLYRRAQEAEVVPGGYNPAQVLMEKPQPDLSREAAYLEVYEAAIFLEACRQDRPPGNLAVPYLGELVATLLLTGARWSEVAGLMAEDVNFERRTVAFRPNRYRRHLKTANAPRVVPLWPQLEETLSEYVAGLRGGPLLFPQRGSPFRPVDNVRRSLDRVATSNVCKDQGWKAGDIRSKMFRHTYCSARLQTLDHGHPVSEFTVAKELGHGGTSLVRRIYGHLGKVPHRASAVEYRLENVPQELRKGLRLA